MNINRKCHSKNLLLIILFFTSLIINSIGCGLVGPVVSRQVYSNPTWIPNSEKIAYFELVDYAIAQVVTAETYKLKLVLHIKSINCPLFHKKIAWTIPKSEWNKYRGNVAHLSFSPKADKIVFSIGRDEFAYKEGQIFIYDFKKGGGFKKIVDNGINPEWSPDGEKIIYQDTKIVDKEGFFTTDDGKMSIGRIDFSQPNWKNQKKLFSIIKTGIGITLIKLLIGEKPKWSTEGKKIIFSAYDRIFITDTDGNSVKHVKVPFEEVADPAFSPDANYVVFCKYRYEEEKHWLKNNLYILDIDKEMIRKEIIEPNGNCINKYPSIFNPVWSPNGEYITYEYNCSSTGIFIIKSDGSSVKLIADYWSGPGL